MNNEAWKAIRGYEGLYEVSDLGRIRSLGRMCPQKSNSTQRKRVRILAQEITVHGYCRVRLFDTYGVAKHYAVHRLVLDAFVGECELQVNHINEIKTDNRLVNLEYCTPKQNCNYGERNAKMANTNKGHRELRVQKVDERGNAICEYPSISAAARDAGVSVQMIRLCCNGKTKTASGHHWRFAK